MDKQSDKDNIEKLIKEVKRNRIVELILIIIIIILLLLFYWMAWRIGKIGFNTEETSSVVVDENDDDDDDQVDIILITEDDVSIGKDTELNIFRNVKYNGEKIIAPWSYGTYKFCVKNENDSDIIYDIYFSDMMTNPVNMVYKLKLDNVYVIGDSENYVTIDELNLEDVVVKEGSNNVYTLEWYWADDDELDTYTGSQEEDQYYTLKLSITAGLYNS